jgi:hypothetical protein
MREQARALHGPFSPTYLAFEVASVLSARNTARYWVKACRPADHSAPLIWCCAHYHDHPDEAAECLQTPLSGDGIFLPPE